MSILNGLLLQYFELSMRFPNRLAPSQLQSTLFPDRLSILKNGAF